MADKENKETTEELEEVSADTEVAETKENKPDKKAKEAAKPGLFSRMKASIKKFWKTMRSEMKKVTWFSRKQTFNSTLLVLVCMASAGVVLGVLDFGFSWVLEWFAGLF